MVRVYRATAAFLPRLLFVGLLIPRLPRVVNAQIDDTCFDDEVFTDTFWSTFCEGLDLLYSESYACFDQPATATELNIFESIYSSSYNQYAGDACVNPSIVAIASCGSAISIPRYGDNCYRVDVLYFGGCSSSLGTTTATGTLPSTGATLSGNTGTPPAGFQVPTRAPTRRPVRYAPYSNSNPVCRLYRLCEDINCDFYNLCDRRRELLSDSGSMGLAGDGQTLEVSQDKHNRNLQNAQCIYDGQSTAGADAFATEVNGNLRNAGLSTLTEFCIDTFCTGGGLFGGIPTLLPSVPPTPSPVDVPHGYYSMRDGTAKGKGKGMLLDSQRLLPMSQLTLKAKSIVTSHFSIAYRKRKGLCDDDNHEQRQRLFGISWKFQGNFSLHEDECL